MTAILAGEDWYNGKLEELGAELAETKEREAKDKKLKLMVVGILIGFGIIVVDMITLVVLGNTHRINNDTVTVTMAALLVAGLSTMFLAFAREQREMDYKYDIREVTEKIEVITAFRDKEFVGRKAYEGYDMESLGECRHIITVFIFKDRQSGVISEHRCITSIQTADGEEIVDVKEMAVSINENNR